MAGVLARPGRPRRVGRATGHRRCSAGLVAAIGSALRGAAWQRCRSHYLRNLLTKVPKSVQPHVATQVRTIFDQPTPTRCTPSSTALGPLAEKYPEAAEHLEAAHADLLACTAYPREIWRQIWSNPQERLNKKIRRRTDVIGIFPGGASAHDQKTTPKDQ